MENHQSSYYSVSYGLTGLKICHYTVHKQEESARERALCQLTECF